MRIAIGSDEAGLAMKETIKGYLVNAGHEVKDYGCYDAKPVDYPEIAYPVAVDVGAGEYDRGILICGTGIGMAITANKVPGVRAAVCHDPYSAERARKSNNAQIMALGARVIGSELAKTLVAIWLESEFAGGGSTRKVEKISQVEKHRQGGPSFT